MKKLSKKNIITIAIVALVVIFVFSRMEIESSDDKTTETTQTEVTKETEETTIKTTEDTAAKLKNEYKLDDIHFADVSVKKIVATINDDQMELSFKWVNDSHDEKTSFIQAGLYVDVTQNEEVIREKDNLFGTVGGNISYQAKQGIETPIVAKYELQNNTDPIKITIGVHNEVDKPVEYIINEKTEENKEETREFKAEQNAKQFPADSVATFKGNKFKGMDYVYEGEIVKYTEAEAIGSQIEPSYLVKNENDYVMIVTPYIFDELPLGAKIKVYGHLNGYEYELTTDNLESINNKFGLINAYSVEELD